MLTSCDKEPFTLLISAGSLRAHSRGRKDGPFPMIAPRYRRMGIESSVAIMAYCRLPGSLYSRQATDGSSYGLQLIAMYPIVSFVDLLLLYSSFIDTRLRVRLFFCFTRPGEELVNSKAGHPCPTDTRPWRLLMLQRPLLLLLLLRRRAANTTISTPQPSSPPSAN